MPISGSVPRKTPSAAASASSRGVVFSESRMRMARSGCSAETPAGVAGGERVVRPGEDGPHREPGVQQADADVVAQLVEVRHAVRRVDHGDLHLAQRHLGPGRPHEHLVLEGEAGLAQRQLEQHGDRIDAEAAQGVAEDDAGLHPQPEVRERPAEARGAGDVRAEAARADHQRLRLVAQQGEEVGEVGRVVLAVRVDGRQMRHAEPLRLARGGQDRLPLAEIALVPQQPHRQPLQGRRPRRRCCRRRRRARRGGRPARAAPRRAACGRGCRRGSRRGALPAPCPRLSCRGACCCA